MWVSQFCDVLRGAADTTVVVGKEFEGWPVARVEAGRGGGAREPMGLTSCFSLIEPLFKGDA